MEQSVVKAICTAHVARDCAHNVFPYTVLVHVFRSVVLLPLVQPAFSGCRELHSLFDAPLCPRAHGAHLSAPRETRARARASERACERERTVSIKYRQSPLLQLQLSGITTSRSEPASDSVATRKTRRINGGHTLKFYLLTIAAHRWGQGGECNFEDARSPMCFNSKLATANRRKRESRRDGADRG